MFEIVFTGQFRDSELFRENVPGKPITERRIYRYIFDTCRNVESPSFLVRVKNSGIIFVIFDHFWTIFSQFWSHFEVYLEYICQKCTGKCQKCTGIFGRDCRFFENSGKFSLFLTFSTFVENSCTFSTFVKSTGTFPVHFSQNFIPGKSSRFSVDFQQSKIFDFRLSRNTKIFWQTHGLKRDNNVIQMGAK